MSRGIGFVTLPRSTARDCIPENIARKSLSKANPQSRASNAHEPESRRKQRIHRSGQSLGFGLKLRLRVHDLVGGLLQGI